MLQDSRRSSVLSGKSDELGEGWRSPITRRVFLVSSAVLAGTMMTSASASPQGTETMYGLISKVDVVSGQRDALVSILLEGVAGMPGCLSYVVANDPENPDAIWITEVWDSQASHDASLSLPSVQDAIAQGGPMIAGFSERIVTAPVGGHGLTS